MNKRTREIINKSQCEKCGGTGRYMYDDNHVKPCEACCTHPDGWWKMEKHYGTDNGKYACKKGCGAVSESVPQNEDDLMELTREALAEVLGREPTKQEILKAHASFKRMAFVMYEHIHKAPPEEGSID